MRSYNSSLSSASRGHDGSRIAEVKHYTGNGVVTQEEKQQQIQAELESTVRKRLLAAAEHVKHTKEYQKLKVENQIITVNKAVPCVHQQCAMFIASKGRPCKNKVACDPSMPGNSEIYCWVHQKKEISYSI